MVRPLDHVTVLQQFQFVEKETQQLQSHPELSRLQSEQQELRRAAEERRKTRESSRSEKTKVHLDDNRQESGRRKNKGRGSGDGRGGNLDIQA